MSWIEWIEESKAQGALAKAYDAISGSRGKVSNIMRVQSLRPKVMAAHMTLYLEILFGRSGLSRAEREYVATVVSIANECPYCVRHHAEALNAYWKDSDRIERLVDDWRAVSVSERESAMAVYAFRLTRDPSSIGEEDIDALRAQGLDDESILSLNLVVSYFNFVNRIALGLGVEFTEEEAQGYEY